MGLLRAAIITYVVYFVWSYIKQTEWLMNVPIEMRYKFAQWVILGLVFFIELF